MTAIVRQRVPQAWRVIAAGLSLLLAAGLVAVASPSTAQQAAPEASTGSGAGVGKEAKISPERSRADDTIWSPLCFQVNSSEYVVELEEAAFTAVDEVNTDRVAVYEGPATVTYTTDETYFISPQGTYAQDANLDPCHPATFGPAGPIDTTLTIEHAGQKCVIGNAEYFRVNTNVSVTGTGSCDIEGDTGLFINTVPTPENTVHTFQGSLAPCAPSPPVPPLGVDDNLCDAPEYGDNHLQGLYSYAGADA